MSGEIRQIYYSIPIEGHNLKRNFPGHKFGVFTFADDTRTIITVIDADGDQETLTTDPNRILGQLRVRHGALLPILDALMLLDGILALRRQDATKLSAGENARTVDEAMIGFATFSQPASPDAANPLEP